MLRFRRGYEASQINGRNKQGIFSEQEKGDDFLTDLTKQNAKHPTRKGVQHSTGLIRLVPGVL